MYTLDSNCALIQYSITTWSCALELLCVLYLIFGRRAVFCIPFFCCCCCSALFFFLLRLCVYVCVLCQWLNAVALRTTDSKLSCKYAQAQAHIFIVYFDPNVFVVFIQKNGFHLTLIIKYARNWLHGFRISYTRHRYTATAYGHHIHAQKSCIWHSHISHRHLHRRCRLSVYHSVSWGVSTMYVAGCDCESSAYLSIICRLIPTPPPSNSYHLIHFTVITLVRTSEANARAQPK